MTPLELAIVLSAVDNASRAITEVQENLEGLGQVGERMTVIGEGLTFGGGLMRAAGDAMGFGGTIRRVMSFQDEVARVNAVLPPTAAGRRQLSQIQEFAISQSQRHAYAAEQVAESVCMGLSSFLSTQQAMAATTVAEQVAMGIHEQLADVRTLGTLYLNFGTKAKPAQVDFQQLRDVMTTLQTQFAFRDTCEITEALKYATSAAQQFHVPLHTALAAIAGFSATGMHGAQAGNAFAEMMNAIGRAAMQKLGIPVARTKNGVLDLPGTLSNLAGWIHAHPGFGAAEQLTKAFGIRGARVELLVAQLSKLDDAQRALDRSTGAGARAQQFAEATASARYQTLKDNLGAVAEKLADLVLPAVTTWIDRLTSGAHAAADFLERHQTIATVLGYSTTALGVLTAGAREFLLILGPMLIAGGQALRLFRQPGTALKIASGGYQTIVLRPIYANDALKSGQGVLSAISIEYPFKAAWQVAQKIGGLFHFHAPPVEGPLRAAVLDFLLGEKLSKHIKLAPVLGPAVRMAQDIARPLTMPLPAMLAPALSTPAPPFLVRGQIGGARRSGGITVNYSPTINISGSASPREEWVTSARQHADELMRIIRDKLYRERRLRFEEDFG